MAYPINPCDSLALLQYLAGVLNVLNSPRAKQRELVVLGKTAPRRVRNWREYHLLNMMQLYSLKHYTSGAQRTVTELKPLSKPGRKYKLAEKAHISEKSI